jgi:hypothetical protein
MMMHHGLLGSVFVLTLVMGFVLFLFLLYHLNLVRQGFTTNESFKWSELVSWRKNCIRKASHAIKVRDMEAHGEKQQQQQQQEGQEGQASSAESAVKENEEPFTDSKDKELARNKEAANEFFKIHGTFANKYNEGFWTNLSYVFWRPSVHLSSDKGPAAAKATENAQQQPSKLKKSGNKGKR